MSGDRRERFVWQEGELEQEAGTVELTPEEEREVDRRLEEAAFDVGEDTYGDWFSGPDR
jgi:hypothetical protein